MLKLHRMMQAQFFGYRSVLGTGCDDGNWILSVSLQKLCSLGPGEQD
jgi:hypothetical protein